MSIIGWWLASGSVANFVASLILEVVLIWHPDYVPENWHRYLLYVLVNSLSAMLNIFGSSLLPLYNQLIFVLSVLTLTSTTFTLFIVARHNHASATFMFSDVSSVTGWPTAGFPFLLAVGNAVFGFLGTDCGAHLCEEIPNPSKNVPRVIMYPLIVGTLTTLPFLSALLYSINDLERVFSTSLPLLEIYYQGTGSAVAATILLCLFTFCMFGCLVAVGECPRSIGSAKMLIEARNNVFSHHVGHI